MNYLVSLFITYVFSINIRFFSYSFFSKNNNYKINLNSYKIFLLTYIKIICFNYLALIISKELFSFDVILVQFILIVLGSLFMYKKILNKIYN